MCVGCARGRSRRAGIGEEGQAWVGLEGKSLGHRGVRGRVMEGAQ